MKSAGSLSRRHLPVSEAAPREKSAHCNRARAECLPSTSGWRVIVHHQDVVGNRLLAGDGFEFALLQHRIDSRQRGA
jgi:hypothetical protein